MRLIFRSFASEIGLEGRGDFVPGRCNPYRLISQAKYYQLLDDMGINRMQNDEKVCTD